MLFSADVIPLAVEEANRRLKAAFRADDDARKVDLSIRSYQDEHGKRAVVAAVEKAEEVLWRSSQQTRHDYLPIAGLADFTTGAARLVFGASSAAIQEQRTVSFQTLSCTGAIHLGALLLSKFLDGKTQPRPVVLVSDPTWGNHHQIFANVGFSTQSHAYFRASSQDLDFAGMLQDLQNAPMGSIVVLQACGHNPTGVDPSRAQWTQIAETMQQRGHIPFFDCTYQGMASGDLDEDAWAMRHFVALGLELFVAHSFSKNLALYGQRVGCLHVVAASQEAAQRVASQLTLLQRCEISNPPAYGARVASLVLNDDRLMAEWAVYLRGVSDHLASTRKDLRVRLETMETPGRWNHITDQTGVYCFTALSHAQVDRLRTDFHVYTTKNGRISVPALNSSNMDYVVMALDKTIREDPDARRSAAKDD